MPRQPVEGHDGASARFWEVSPLWVFPKGDGKSIRKGFKRWADPWAARILGKVLSLLQLSDCSEQIIRRWVRYRNPETWKVPEGPRRRSSEMRKQGRVPLLFQIRGKKNISGRKTKSRLRGTPPGKRRAYGLGLKR